MGNNKKSKKQEYLEFGKSLVATIRADKNDYKQKTMEKLQASLNQQPKTQQPIPISKKQNSKFSQEKMQIILDKIKNNKK